MHVSQLIEPAKIYYHAKLHQNLSCNFQVQCNFLDQKYENKNGGQMSVNSNQFWDSQLHRISVPSYIPGDS